ncbi:nucleopolyhedrovirus P10 family protein [Streptomyces cavernae]|uniref:nucleopolyhedrovirus P10 family protein n=1 Tax=Streptomyces cavernae TaxID=2259034 RepID=UPI000FEC190C|nr:nucleopolyhedrovirus P10 family protein [Streptomyces cavernae]
MRRLLGLGRLLPLGGPRDGAWLAESAADTVLRRAASELRGVRLGSLRVSLADPENSYEPAVPPPPSALPPGPLRIRAEFEATAAEPLPTAATRLRSALAAAARERLGLTVTEVDLRVTRLLDEEPGGTGNGLPERDTGAAAQGTDSAAEAPPDDEESRVTAAVLATDGVVRLTGMFGGLGRAVHFESVGGAGAGAVLAGRHVWVEFAVSAERRALDVARAVRGAVGGALTDRPTVAVLVTAVE